MWRWLWWLGWLIVVHVPIAVHIILIVDWLLHRDLKQPLNPKSKNLRKTRFSHPLVTLQFSLCVRVMVRDWFKQQQCCVFSFCVGL